MLIIIQLKLKKQLFQTFPDPSLTTFEVEKQKLMEQVDAQGVVLPVTASQLLKLVEQFKDSERLEK